MTKYFVEIEVSDEYSEMDSFHQELQLAIDSVDREGSMDILQIEEANWWLSEEPYLCIFGGLFGILRSEVKLMAVLKDPWLFAVTNAIIP